jgi:hypothetical protein
MNKRMIVKHRWNITNKERKEYSEKALPRLPIFILRLPHVLAWDRTCAFAVRERHATDIGVIFFKMLQQNLIKVTE